MFIFRKKKKSKE